MNYIRVYLGLFGVSMLGMLGIYFCLPDRGVYLYMEDALIENLGALILVSTSVLGIVFAVLSKKNRAVILLISITGLLGFLFELGFGKRYPSLDHYHFGEVIMDTTYDFLHFIFEILRNLHQTHPVLLYVSIGIPILVAILLFLKNRHTLNDFTNRGRYTQSYLLAALFVILSLAGIIIDLLNIGRNGIIALEETIELNAALALLFCLLSIYQKNYFSIGNSSYS